MTDRVYTYAEWRSWPELDARCHDALIAHSLGLRDVRHARGMRTGNGLGSRRALPAEIPVDTAAISAASLRRIFECGESTIRRIARALGARGHGRLQHEVDVVYDPTKPDPVKRAREALVKLRDADPDFFRAALGDDEALAVYWFAVNGWR